MHLLLDKTECGPSFLDAVAEMIFEKSRQVNSVRLDGELKISEMFDNIKFNEKIVSLALGNLPRFYDIIISQKKRNSILVEGVAF